jgi:glycosyltransferase involved in cell wall biosynthesis
MRLLYMVSKWPPIGGGAATGARQLARWMAAKGHTVDVVTERFPGLPSMEREGNLTVHRVRAAAAGPARFALLNLIMSMKAVKLARQGVDLMHVHDVSVGASGMMVKKLTGVPTVFKYGGHLTYEYLSLQSPAGWDPAAGELAAWRWPGSLDLDAIRRLESSFFDTYDSVYLLARYQRELLESMGIAGNFPIVPNGIDITSLPAPGPYDERTILTGLRLVPWKGLGTLISACKGLLTKHDARLVIAGDGPDAPRLRGLARSLGADGRRITFLGNIPGPDLLQRLTSAAIYAFPSLVDRSPHALFEAMALARPVVASEVPGVSEFVPTGRGLLFRPGDADDLHGKLELLLESPSTAQRIGKAARRWASERLGFETTARRVLKLYNEAIL